MIESKLKNILNSSVEDICRFILETESKLDEQSRNELIEFLENNDFSSKKYQILTADSKSQIRAVLLGLIFGQVDPHVAQFDFFTEGYNEKLSATCSFLGLSADFICPISRYNKEICSFFDL